MPHEVVLVLHVVAGGVGLLAAPVAVLSRRCPSRHMAAGRLYQACVVVLCVTTVLLVAADPTLWPFLLLALGTQAAAAGAVVVRRRRRPGWLPMHVQLVLGSYVSFVTAFTVQAVGGLLSWLVPVVLGSAVVGVATTRVARGQRRPLPARV